MLTFFLLYSYRWQKKWLAQQLSQLNTQHVRHQNTVNCKNLHFLSNPSSYPPLNTFILSCFPLNSKPFLLNHSLSFKCLHDFSHDSLFEDFGNPTIYGDHKHETLLNFDEIMGRVLNVSFFFGISKCGAHQSFIFSHYQLPSTERETGMAIVVDDYYAW